MTTENALDYQAFAELCDYLLHDEADELNTLRPLLRQGAQGRGQSAELPLEGLEDLDLAFIEACELSVLQKTQFHEARSDAWFQVFQVTMDDGKPFELWWRLDSGES